MADYYEINPFKRSVSIVVLLIDAYTQMPVTESVKVSVREAGVFAIAKNDGHYVFVNLPDRLWHIDISSEQFFSQTLTADTGKSKAVIKVRLIPSSGYKLPRNATFLDGICKPGTEIYAIPIGHGRIWLRRQEPDSITLRCPPDWDLSDQLFAFYNEDEVDILKIGAKINKFTYNAALEKHYELGTELYPVTIGRADINGRLLCPLRWFYEEHREVLILPLGAEASAYFKCAVSYGKGNVLKL